MWLKLVDNLDRRSYTVNTVKQLEPKMKAAKIVKTYVSTEGIVITVYAAAKQPKPISAKPKGSSKHCGRTNLFGIRV
jgi:hypothetical protein